MTSDKSELHCPHNPQLLAFVMDKLAITKLIIEDFAISMTLSHSLRIIMATKIKGFGYSAYRLMRLGRYELGLGISSEDLLDSLGLFFQPNSIPRELCRAAESVL